MSWRVGQEVSVFDGNRIKAVRRVVRLTKTLVILEDGMRYRVKNGYETPKPTWPAHIIPTTQEHKNLLAKHDLAHYMNYSVVWSRLSLEALQDIKQRIEDDLSK